MADLMRLTQLPFLNIRCAALAIIRSIADQPWGQRTLHQHPGFQVSLKNKAGYTATEDACGWAGAVIKKANQAFE